MSIWTGQFWKAAAERAVKTFAQAEGALLLAAGTGILDTAWETTLSISGMAAVISLLTSVGSDVATGEGPSLTNAETLVDSPSPDEGGMATTEFCLLVIAVASVVYVLFGANLVHR